MARVCFYCARFEHDQFQYQPLGIAYIAAYLVDQGICREEEVLIADNYKEAILFKPDILAISSVSHVINDGLKFVEEVNKVHTTYNVLGGYHITCDPNRLPAAFPIGVLSEGEETFAEIVQRYDRGDLEYGELKKIKGICYRNTDNEVEKTEKRPYVDNLDELPMPVRLDNENYKEISLLTSRGCPYDCIFCASQTFWGEKFRFRSSESVLEEIRDIAKKYQGKKIVINIIDDLWMANRKRFQEVANAIIEEGLNKDIEYIGFVRSNLIHEKELLLLKKMNYKVIRFGAETGSEILLRKIKGHNITMEDHQRCVDLCHKYKIPCTASFLFGVPGETREDLQCTADFLRKNKGKISVSGFYYCNPIPGTSLWTFLRQKNIIDQDFGFEKLPLDFISGDFDWKNVVYFNEESIPFEEFKQILEDMRKEFCYKQLLGMKVKKYFNSAKDLYKKVLAG